MIKLIKLNLHIILLIYLITLINCINLKEPSLTENDKSKNPVNRKIEEYSTNTQSSDNKTINKINHVISKIDGINKIPLHLTDLNHSRNFPQQQRNNNFTKISYDAIHQILRNEDGNNDGGNSGIELSVYQQHQQKVYEKFNIKKRSTIHSNKKINSNKKVKMKLNSFSRKLNERQELNFKFLNAKARKIIEKRSIKFFNQTSQKNSTKLSNLILINNKNLTQFSLTRNFLIEKNLNSDLISINLSNNSLTNISFSFTLNTLNLLDLSNNKLSEFILNDNLESIKILNLTNNNVSNFTVSITNNESNLKIKLKNLYLHSNCIKTLKNINLNLLNDLEILDLSLNRIESFNELFLYKNNLKNLKLLNLSKNNLKSFLIPTTTATNEKNESDISLTKNPNNNKNYDNQFNNKNFENISNYLLNIETLLLSHNNIEIIDFNNYKFFILQNLQYLDLSNNNLHGDTIKSLQGIPNLIGLSIAHNLNLGDESLQEFVASWSLKELDASGTGLCRIPSALAQSVRALKLTDNWFSIINCGDLDSYPLLKYLDLSNSHIEDIEDDALGRLEMLETLFLDNNQLKRIPQSLPTQLENLFLKSNLINEIKSKDFQNLQNLKTLDLSENKLIYIPGLPLPKLLILNLQSTELKSLSQSLIKESPKLRDLLLDNNPIKCSDLMGIAEWSSGCHINDDRIENNYNNNNNNATDEEDMDSTSDNNYNDDDAIKEYDKKNLKLYIQQKYNYFLRFHSYYGEDDDVMNENRICGMEERANKNMHEFNSIFKPKCYKSQQIRNSTSVKSSQVNSKINNSAKNSQKLISDNKTIKLTSNISSALPLRINSNDDEILKNHKIKINPLNLSDQNNQKTIQKNFTIKNSNKILFKNFFNLNNKNKNFTNNNHNEEEENSLKILLNSNKGNHYDDNLKMINSTIAIPTTITINNKTDNEENLQNNNNNNNNNNEKNINLQITTNLPFHINTNDKSLSTEMKINENQFNNEINQNQNKRNVIKTENLKNINNQLQIEEEKLSDDINNRNYKFKHNNENLLKNNSMLLNSGYQNDNNQNVATEKSKEFLNETKNKSNSLATELSEQYNLMSNTLAVEAQLKTQSTIKLIDHLNKISPKSDDSVQSNNLNKLKNALHPVALQPPLLTVNEHEFNDMELNENGKRIIADKLENHIQQNKTKLNDNIRTNDHYKNPTSNNITTKSNSPDSLLNNNLRNKLNENNTIKSIQMHLNEKILPTKQNNEIVKTIKIPPTRNKENLIKNTTISLEKLEQKQNTYNSDNKILFENNNNKNTSSRYVTNFQYNNNSRNTIDKNKIILNKKNLTQINNIQINEYNQINLMNDKNINGNEENSNKDILTSNKIPVINDKLINRPDHHHQQQTQQQQKQQNSFNNKNNIEENSNQQKLNLIELLTSNQNKNHSNINLNLKFHVQKHKINKNQQNNLNEKKILIIDENKLKLMPKINENELNVNKANDIKFNLRKLSPLLQNNNLITTTFDNLENESETLTPSPLIQLSEIESLMDDYHQDNDNDDSSNQNVSNDDKNLAHYNNDNNDQLNGLNQSNPFNHYNLKLYKKFLKDTNIKLELNHLNESYQKHLNTDTNILMEDENKNFIKNYSSLHKQENKNNYNNNTFLIPILNYIDNNENDNNDHQTKINVEKSYNDDDSLRALHLVRQNLLPINDMKNENEQKLNHSNLNIAQKNNVSVLPSTGNAKEHHNGNNHADIIKLNYNKFNLNVDHKIKSKQILKDNKKNNAEDEDNKNYDGINNKNNNNKDKSQNNNGNYDNGITKAQQEKLLEIRSSFYDNDKNVMTNLKSTLFSFEHPSLVIIFFIVVTIFVLFGFIHRCQYKNSQWMYLHQQQQQQHQRELNENYQQYLNNYLFKSPPSPEHQCNTSSEMNMFVPIIQKRPNLSAFHHSTIPNTIRNHDIHCSDSEAQHFEVSGNGICDASVLKRFNSNLIPMELLKVPKDTDRTTETDLSFPEETVTHNLNRSRYNHLNNVNYNLISNSKINDDNFESRNNESSFNNNDDNCNSKNRKYW